MRRIISELESYLCKRPRKTRLAPLLKVVFRESSFILRKKLSRFWDQCSQPWNIVAWYYTACHGSRALRYKTVNVPSKSLQYFFSLKPTQTHSRNDYVISIDKSSLAFLGRHVGINFEQNVNPNGKMVHYLPYTDEQYLR